MWIGLLCLITGISVLGFLRWDVISDYFGWNSKQNAEQFEEELTKEAQENNHIIPNDTTQNRAVVEIQEEIDSGLIEEELIENEVELVEPPITEEPIAEEPVNEKQYHVVGGSFSKEENAMSFVDQLKGKGYTAKNLGKRNGLYTVSYGGSNSKADAKALLNRIKSDEPDAGGCWILFY